MRIRAIAVVGLAAVLLSLNAQPQEPQVPSIGQCKMDIQLWAISGDRDLAVATADMSYVELTKRGQTLARCSLAYRQDLDPHMAGLLTITEQQYTAVGLIRLEHFIDRHGLWNKFYEDDLNKKLR